MSMWPFSHPPRAVRTFLRRPGGRALDQAFRRQLALEPSGTPPPMTGHQWLRLESQFGQRGRSALQLQLPRRQTLRYGENPHQQRRVGYQRPRTARLGAARSCKGQGESASTTTMSTLDACLGHRCVSSAYGPCPLPQGRSSRRWLVVKQHNPCGLARSGADGIEGPQPGPRCRTGSRPSAGNRAVNSRWRLEAARLLSAACFSTCDFSGPVFTAPKPGAAGEQPICGLLEPERHPDSARPPTASCAACFGGSWLGAGARRPSDSRTVWPGG